MARLTDRLSHFGSRASHFARERFLAARESAVAHLERFKEPLLRIPAVQLVVRTFHELGADDATHMAAGVSYYAILSLFPLLLALIGIFGIFLPSETVQEKLLDFIGENLPGAIDFVERNITDVIQARAALGVLGVIGLLWSASAMFGAIGRAVNRAWDVHQDRPIYIRKVRDLTMALGVGALFFMSLGATSLFSILQDVEFLQDIELPVIGPIVGTAIDVGARFFAFFMSLAIFLLVYRFLPNTKTYWRYVWPGALLAAILFEIAKSLFVYYLDDLADFQAVYGSVGSVIALLVWIYFSALILILGAEFSSEYERMRKGVGRGVLVTDSPPDDL